MHDLSCRTTRRAPSRSALLTGFVVVALAGTAGVALVATPAAAAAKVTVYGGYAFGTSGHVGTYSNNGRSAVSSVCTTQSGVRRTNHTGATRIPNVGTVGAVSTSTTTHRLAVGPESLATTSTAGTKLLSRIRATTITSSARVVRTATGYVRTAQTSVVGLTIAGHASPPVHPAVDQKVTLPGIATIVFNHQVKSHQFGAYHMSVVAMTVTIPKNNSIHAPVGTIRIGRSTASLQRPTFANPKGYAFGSQIVAAKIAGSGRTALVFLPCGGTGGATMHHNASSAHAPNVLRTGDNSSTGYSQDTASSTVARLTNLIADPRLFGGTVKATQVKVLARASRDAAGTLKRSNQVRILGFTVNGQTKSGQVPANTKVSIPNLGTLWVHRVVNTPNGLVVHGLDLVLTVTKNGLKKGSEIIVGSASAAVNRR